MVNDKFVRCLLVSLSFSVVLLGGSAVGYVAIHVPAWNAERDNKNVLVQQWDLEQGKKAAFVGIASLDAVDSYTNIEHTTAIITNPTNGHVAVCVKGRIIAAAGGQFDSTTQCFPDIGPHSTVNKDIPINDFHNNLIDICYDQDKYKPTYDRYQQRLAQWESTMQDYRNKAEQNPIYAQAIDILTNKKPTPPEKLFSWKSCSFALIDAFPVERNPAVANLASK